MEILLIMIAIILWILLCFVVANAWKNVGLSYKIGFWNSFLFSPLIGILLGLLFVCGKNNVDKSTIVELTQSRQTPKIIYCPYCGKKTSGEKQVCQECNKDISRIFKESEYNCSHCKKDVPEDASYCWNCGETLE